MRLNIGTHPLADGIGPAAVQTPGYAELSRALGTRCSRLKCVECIPAIGADPIVSCGRRSCTTWTNKTPAPGQLRQLGQASRVLPSAPAIHQDKSRHYADPERLHPKGQENQPCGPEEADDSRRHQAACPAHDKPQQRTKDLAAIQ